LEGYFIAIPKPKSKAIPCSGYSITPWAKFFWSNLLKGYCKWLGILNAHAIPLVGYPKNPLDSITYILKLETWRGIALPCQNVEGKQYSHHIVIIF